MAQYLVPPDRKPASVAPSLTRIKKGVGTDGTSTNAVGNAGQGVPYLYDVEAEPGNPTVVPQALLKQFHFTFLIRHPRSSVPSYYRCTVPPLDKVTGFFNFMPSEMGYDELRQLFDYLRSIGHIGPKVSGRAEATNKDKDGKGPTDQVDICVIDADELLDNPSGNIEAYCKSVGLDYDPGMLNWDTEDDRQQAKDGFAKWAGFHDDAISSTSLKPRQHVSPSAFLSFNYNGVHYTSASFYGYMGKLTLSQEEKCQN